MCLLSEQEQAELIRLLGKMRFPVSTDLFYAWCKSSIAVAVEIFAMRKTDKGREIFLTYREDPFYKGWHVPGSIYLPSERIADTRTRVLEKELGLPGSSKLEFFQWTDQPIGDGIGQNPRGNGISLSFIHEVTLPLAEHAEGKFFPLSYLPADLLPIQVPMLNALVAHVSRHDK